MVALAPVMYVGNQTSPIVHIAEKYGLDTYVINHFMEVLWLKKGSGLLADIIVDIAPRCLELVPRTTWTVVQSIVGFDEVSHMSEARMPMMARNDVGGTSTTNLKHWDQMMKDGRFAPLSKDGE